MPVARAEGGDRTAQLRLHPPGHRTHHRFAVPDQCGRHHRGTQVADDHEQVGGGRRSHRAEGGEIEVMLMPGEHGGPGRSAQQLEHDVEGRLADRHGRRDPEP